MNCKPGDLAFYRGPPGSMPASYEAMCLDAAKTGNFNLMGKVVRCIRIAHPAIHYENLGTFRNVWEVDPPLNTFNGKTPYCPDSWLTPIRDSDGDDETLTWAGLPNKQTEAA